MFEFGMETRRICDIINEGAKTRMNDRDFIARELSRWLTSAERRAQMDGDLYYGYVQDVLKKQRYIIGEDGALTVDKNLPNHRMIDNQYSKMVDQKVNYMLSKPITLKTENKQYEEILSGIFNKRFHKIMKNVGKDSYNGGCGYLYPYYNERGEFCFKRFHPWEVKVYWADDEHTEIDFFWHYYERVGYEGRIEATFKYLDIYDTNGVHKFEYKNGGLIPDYSTYHFELDKDNQTEEYNWNRVPLIAFPAYSNNIPLLKKCKSLQDAINQILSEFNDGMEENASGNSIIIIKNYDGENLGTFRRNMAQYKAVKVRTVDGADGGIDKLEITVNAQNYQTILYELKKALIQNCRGYDVEELKSSGSPNEMSIKSIFSDIDLDANELETEYQASFENLLWFVNVHLVNSGMGDYSTDDIDVIFNRDMMVNESQIIQDINNSAALLSKKTLISMHPWITDVDGELKQLDEEQEKALEVYGNMMVQKPEGGTNEIE